MFCPQCGANQSDELKFCKLCGANLYAVRQAVATRETGEKFDWSRTWVAEMFLSEGERKRRKEELERLRGTTSEIQRSREIKAGVITASVGIGVAIFLYVFMQGIILSGNVAPDAVEILRRLWVVGVIPLCIGIGLVFNGVVVSRKLVRAASQASTKLGALERETDPHFLRSADTAGLDPPNFSVTEETTRHLKGPDQNER
ncbi:MAG: hypothetical protein AABO57_06430 [Acidobacteriota bacterium]